MPVGGDAGPTSQANPALLHWFLGIGLVLVVAALVTARQMGIGTGDADASMRTVGYALAAVSFVQAAVALLLLKPRVRARGPGQSPAQYWADRNVAAAAFRVWFLIEGAGIIAAVGYFLSGVPTAAALAGLSAAVFWLNGPRAFEK